MESSIETGTFQEDLIDREKAVKTLDDQGEHKFLFETDGGPVFIVGTSLEDLRKDNVEPRLHEQILKSLVEKRLITDEKKVKGGYCRVDGGELLFWGPSTYPVEAAKEKAFEDAVEIGKIRIIDQWLGENPAQIDITET